MPPTASEAPGLAWVDLGVVLGVLLFTTWVGHRAAGRQRDARDFFLGGRRLPWYAVAASLVATEISAVTFVGLPATVAAEGGNLTYLQVVLIGALIARGLVAWLLVPAYFEREIYSPYDYIGRRLGPQGRAVTTAVFAIGGILAQAARVYLTALVLEVLLHGPLGHLEAATGIPPLVASVGVVTLVAVAWTWMGGIATVVWTDAVLFLLFLIGVVVLGVVLHAQLEGGFPAAVEAAREVDRVQWLDLSGSWLEPHSLLVVVALASWGMVGDYGCNQLLVQRLLACPSVRDARRAVLASAVGALAIVGIAFVGVGLAHWTATHGFHPRLRAFVVADSDRLLPAFLLQAVPTGWKGLVLAAIVASAISSLDSILAALAQTTSTVLRLDQGDPGRVVRRSRWLVVGFAVLLAVVAVGLEPVHAERPSILKLALRLGSLSSGILLGTFVFALVRREARGDGIGFAAGAAGLVVLGVARIDGAAPVWYAVGAVGLAAAFGVARWRRPFGRPDALQLLVLLAVASGGAAWRLGEGPDLPWPWYAPIGAVATLTLGWGLDGARVAGGAGAERDAGRGARPRRS